MEDGGMEDGGMEDGASGRKESQRGNIEVLSSLCGTDKTAPVI